MSVNLVPLSCSLLMYPTRVETPLVVPIRCCRHVLLLLVVVLSFLRLLLVKKHALQMLCRLLGSAVRRCVLVLVLMVPHVLPTVVLRHPMGAGTLLATTLSVLRKRFRMVVWLVLRRWSRWVPFRSVSVRVTSVMLSVRLERPLGWESSTRV